MRTPVDHKEGVAVTFPPFDFTRDRQRYPGDGTVTTTYSLVAFYRRFTYSYTRQMRGRERVRITP